MYTRKCVKETPEFARFSLRSYVICFFMFFFYYQRTSVSSLALYFVIFLTSLFHIIFFLIFIYRFPNFPEAQSSYNKIVQSGILRILDAANSSLDEANRLDELTVLLAIKVKGRDGKFAKRRTALH